MASVDRKKILEHIALCLRRAGSYIFGLRFVNNVRPGLERHDPATMLNGLRPLHEYLDGGINAKYLSQFAELFPCHVTRATKELTLRISELARYIAPTLKLEK